MVPDVLLSFKKVTHSNIFKIPLAFLTYLHFKVLVFCCLRSSSKIYFEFLNFDQLYEFLIIFEVYPTNLFSSYLSEFGDHYLRKSNETLCLIDCDISFNNQEVLLVQSFNSMVLEQSNISETTIIINDTKITDNNRGIRQFSRFVEFAFLVV